jgi:hypothetical protein
MYTLLMHSQTDHSAKSNHDPEPTKALPDTTDTTFVTTPDLFPIVADNPDNTPQQDDIPLPPPDSPLKDHRFMKELESHLGKAFDPINETRRPRASIAHAYSTFSDNTYIDTPEPTTYIEAINSSKSSQWQESINAEFQSWIKNGVAEIVDQNDLPPDAKLIQGRPVFKRKINEIGEVV